MVAAVYGLELCSEWCQSASILVLYLSQPQFFQTHNPTQLNYLFSQYNYLTVQCKHVNFLGRSIPPLYTVQNKTKKQRQNTRGAYICNFYWLASLFITCFMNIVCWAKQTIPLVSIASYRLDHYLTPYLSNRHHSSFFTPILYGFGYILSIKLTSPEIKVKNNKLLILHKL